MRYGGDTTNLHSHHALLERLQTRETGLTAHEVAERTKRFGYNELPAPTPKPRWRVFVEQFASPLIYLLLAAVVVLTVRGDTADAAIVFTVLVVNALIGTLQEGRAQQALAALNRFSFGTAVVTRDGEDQDISERELVPGDIVHLKEGQRVPADIQLLHAHGLGISEAILTGESEPVRKHSEPLHTGLHPDDTPIFQQVNVAFKGTFVSTGSGTGVVIGTGLNTELGAISKELNQEPPEIPLHRNVRALSHQIILAALGLGTALILYGLALGQPLDVLFATAVSLTVSIVPEGLPIVLTYVLATGVARMSKRNVLVKKLQSVEALGQAHVIAVDKTGTITRNQLAVHHIWCAGKHYQVEADGFEPQGTVSHGGTVLAQVPEALERAARAAALTATAGLHKDDNDQWYVAGEPTEAALAVAAGKLGVVREELEEVYELLEDTGFDYAAKLRLVLHKVRGAYLVSVAGAPEAVLARTGLSQEEKGALLAIQEEMAAEGLRVVAVGHERFTERPDLKAKHHFKLDALFGMQDSLQPGLKAAVTAVQRAGIRVVMITGDHAGTAEAIARQAGIFHDGDLVLTGQQLEALSEGELIGMVGKLTVCARVTPEHKLRIVQAFQAAGHTIAMTGDGVNDAPSLVAADLGIAMGGRGTDVAKEAADLVLLDDNFTSIVAAVEEGRGIYQSIQRVVTYLFAGSASQVLLLLFSLLLLLPIPLLPSQIIWLNFVTDSFMVLALAAERRSENLLEPGYVHPRGILTVPLATRALAMALPMSLAAFVAYVSYVRGSDQLLASTMALTALAASHWVGAWSARTEGSVFAAGLTSNRFLVGMTVLAVSCQLLVIYTPFLQTVFHTRPLGTAEWALVLGGALATLAVEEVRKLCSRHLVARTA